MSCSKKPEYTVTIYYWIIKMNLKKPFYITWSDTIWQLNDVV